MSNRPDASDVDVLAASSEYKCTSTSGGCRFMRVAMFGVFSVLYDTSAHQCMHVVVSFTGVLPHPLLLI